MANDERKGDDLFEDLDKFFAPIKDVDWDEREPEASSTPQEEHVSVRSDPSAASRGADASTGRPMEAPTAASPPPPAPSAPPSEPPPVVEPHAAPPDDEAWYDTGVLESVASLDEDVDEVGTRPEPIDEGTVRIVSDQPPLRPPDEQADLFAEANAAPQQIPEPAENKTPENDLSDKRNWL